MRIIAIDPGGQTGIATFHGKSHELIHTMSVDLDDLERILKSLEPIDLNDIFVVETPPPDHSSKNLESAIRTIVAVLERVNLINWVMPGHWKPSPQGRLTHLDFPTEHEKDAVRMGMYFIQLELKE